jgi:hypothetical protein
MNFRTCESSDTEFGEQENDALLLDIGVGDTAYVRDKNFLWADGDNYIGRETFCGISRAQDCAKGLTNTLEKFEQFFDKDMVQEIATEPNCYAEQFKISWGNTFSKWSRVNEWQPMTAEEMYIVLALFVLMGTVQKPSMTLHLSRNHVAATPVFGSVIALDRFEIICRFPYFINTSNDTSEGPQNLFKIYTIN